MNKKLITFLSVTIVILLLAFTCPDKQKHNEALTYFLSGYVDKKLCKESTDNALSMFGTLFTSKYISMFLDSKMKVDNYIIFSIGNVSYKGTSNMMSLGILNKVFVLFDENDLDEKLENMEISSEDNQ